jgi:hypothetical protein
LQSDNQRLQYFARSAIGNLCRDVKAFVPIALESGIVAILHEQLRQQTTELLQVTGTHTINS